MLRATAAARRSSIGPPVVPLPPTVANTGPRTSLTVNSTNGTHTGFNQTVGGDGIVRYTGINFTGTGLQFAANGPASSIAGYVFTDCAFPNGALFASGIGVSGLVFDHCSAGEVSTITNSGYPVTMTRCCWLGTTASPFQFWRYTTGGAVGTSLVSTPMTVTECLFKSPFPAPVPGGNHFEAIHIRGGKDMTFTRCATDVGWNFNPGDTDGSATPITSNIYIEGGYGGNDAITFDSCWHYGAGPFYGVVYESTNLTMQNGFWAQCGAQGDLSHDGSSQAGPWVSVQNFGGQSSTATLSGYRWLRDSTPVGASTRANADNSHTSFTWN